VEKRFKNAWFIFLSMFYVSSIAFLDLTILKLDLGQYNSYTILFINFIVLIIYLILKFIINKFNFLLSALERNLKKLKESELVKNWIGNMEEGIFYYKYNDRFFIHKNPNALKSIFYAMSVLLFFILNITIIIIAISAFEDNILHTIPKFYMFGIILFGEIGWFLDGDIRLKPQKKKATIDEDDLEVRFSSLTKEYKTIWGNNCLRHGQFSYINKNFSEYEKIKDKYNREVEENILKGKDLIIETSFFNDIRKGLFEAITSILTEGKSMLVVCDEISSVKRISKWIESGISESLQTDCIFTISTWPDDVLRLSTIKDRDPDIIVCTADIIGSIDVIPANILKKIDMILLVDGVSIASRQSVNLVCLSRILESVKEENIQYVCLTPHCDGIESTLRHLLKANFYNTITVSLDRPVKVNYMIWKNDVSSWYQEQLLKGYGGRFLGNLVPLTLPAIKFGIKNIAIVQCSKKPVLDDLTNIGKNSELVNDYIKTDEIKLSTYLNKVIEISSKEIDIFDKRHKMYIVEDSEYNIPRAYRKWKDRGQSDLYMHIVTEPYLLRDYFTDNLDYFINSKLEINRMTPFLPGSVPGLAMSVLWRLKNKGLNEGLILRKLKQAGILSKDPIAGLKELFDKAFGYNKDIMEDIQIYEKVIFEKSEGDASKIRFNKVKIIRLANINEILPARIVKYVEIVDETGKHQLLDTIRRSQVEQNFIEGQHVVYNGRNYRIKSLITSSGIEQGKIILRSIPKENNSIFIQKRKYGINLYGELNDSFFKHEIKGKYEIEIREKWCELDIDIEGYYTFYNKINVSKGYFSFEKNKKKNFQYDAERCKNVCTLELIIKNVDYDLITKQKIAFSLSIMLNEIFKTLFPETFQYLSAAMYLDKEEHDFWLTQIKDEALQVYDIYPQIVNLNIEMIDINDIRIYIIEDSGVDSGMLGMIKERLLPHIFPVLEDYLHWMLDFDEEKGFEGENININKKEFFSYGLKDIPSCFAFNELYKILRVINLGRKSISISRGKYYGLNLSINEL
jgi:hypothetical protein